MKPALRSILIIMSLSIAARAAEPRFIPMDVESLSPGRSLYLSPDKDTLPLCGDPAQPALIKIRDVRYDKNFPGETYGKFRIGNMEFTEFVYLRRSGDSLHFTVVPGKAAGNGDFYPLCIRLQDVGRLYDRVFVGEKPDLDQAEESSTPPGRMGVGKAFGYTALAIVAGGTVGAMGGMTYVYMTEKTGPAAFFGYAAAGCSIGMVFGFSVGMEFLVMPAILGPD